MKSLLKFLLSVGIVILILIAICFGLILIQTRQAKELCSSYKPGDRIPSIDKMTSGYLLHPMGPYELTENPGFQHVIFCASATMCDVSCQIKYKDGVISEIKYEEY